MVVADRQTKGFSQGQRTKVALARSLVHDPHNVILDEPTSGLDVTATRSLREIIRKARAAGARVLLLGMDLPTNYGPAYSRGFAAIYETIAIDTGVVLVPGFVRAIQRQHSWWWVQDLRWAAAYQFPNTDKTFVSNVVHNAGLILLEAVGFGAEVMADGHIHAYGPLRGRALAGVTGAIVSGIRLGACPVPALPVQPTRTREMASHASRRLKWGQAVVAMNCTVTIAL